MRQDSRAGNGKGEPAAKGADLVAAVPDQLRIPPPHQSTLSIALQEIGAKKLVHGTSRYPADNEKTSPARFSNKRHDSGASFSD